MKYLLIFIPILFSLLQTQCEAAGWTHYNITILNEVNNMDVTVHCFSKDNELGTHLLKFEQSFSWTFKPNVIAQTKFYCHFLTPQRDIGRYAVYDLRIAQRIIKAYGKSGTLVWSVRPGNQMCLLDGNLKLHTCFNY